MENYKCGYTMQKFEDIEVVKKKVGDYLRKLSEKKEIELYEVGFPSYTVMVKNGRSFSFEIMGEKGEFTKEQAAYSHSLYRDNKLHYLIVRSLQDIKDLVNIHKNNEEKELSEFLRDWAWPVVAKGCNN